MNRYYLRIEGVNMDSFVYDTNDLNTIRGGGLLLLEAAETKVEGILKACTRCKGIEPISKGASWGLFEIAAENSRDAAAIRKAVQSGLSNDSLYRHATFVVDVLPAPSQQNQFNEVRDKLHALNRWRQMQSPSVAVPTLENIATSKPANAVCAIDNIRPGSKKIKVANQTVIASASVKSRRDFGQDQKKRDFYEHFTNLRGLSFTQDLNDLSSDPDKGILHHKIAVIHIDGNRFGDIQRTECRTKQDQHRFDEKLKEGQKKILKKLLRTANQDPSGSWKNENKIRLETLLWGGDEIIWVVPAWLGWSTLALFYKQAGERMKFRGELLTHAAGLVFCHHNAPIDRVKRLAEDLTKLAKMKDKDENWFTYQVLESFDHVGMDLDSHQATKVHNITTVDHLLLQSDKMEVVEKSFMELRQEDFPRRKIYQILNALQDGNRTKAEEYIEKLNDEQGFKKPLTDLDEVFEGDRDAKWLHLMDLWDYVAPEDKVNDAN